MSCRATVKCSGISAPLGESAARQEPALPMPTVREGRVPPRRLVLVTRRQWGTSLRTRGRVEFHLDRWFWSHAASGRRRCGRAGGSSSTSTAGFGHTPPVDGAVADARERVPPPTSPDGATETPLHGLRLRWEDLFEHAVAVGPDGLGVANEREVVLHDWHDESFWRGGRSHVDIVENLRRFA